MEEVEGEGINAERHVVNVKVGRRRVVSDRGERNVVNGEVGRRQDGDVNVFGLDDCGSCPCSLFDIQDASEKRV